MSCTVISVLYLHWQTLVRERQTFVRERRTTVRERRNLSASGGHLSANGGHCPPKELSGGLSGGQKNLADMSAIFLADNRPRPADSMSAADNCPPIVRQRFKNLADKIHRGLFGGLFFGGLSAS